MDRSPFLNDANDFDPSYARERGWNAMPTRFFPFAWAEWLAEAIQSNGYSDLVAYEIVNETISRPAVYDASRDSILSAYQTQSNGSMFFTNRVIDFVVVCHGNHDIRLIAGEREFVRKSTGMPFEREFVRKSTGMPFDIVKNWFYDNARDECRGQNPEEDELLYVRMWELYEKCLPVELRKV